MILFAGCQKNGNENESGKKVTDITFLTPLSGADGSYMDKIIQGFNEANPDIKVSHFVVEQSTEYKQKLSTGVSSGSAPEVVLIRKFDMPLYFDQFEEIPIEDLMNHGIDTNDIYPNLLSGLERENSILGIPLDVWIFYMAYNRANFLEAGLDPDNPPINREEFVADMKALKRITPKGVTPYYEDLTWGWIWAHLLWQFGGDFLSEDFKSPAFKEKGVEVIKFLMQLQEEGIIPDTVVDAGPAFESGDSSVLITGVWTINAWYELFGSDFGYAAAPQLGSTQSVFGGSHIIALTKDGNADPIKREASMRWVKYLWDHMLDWYRAGQTPSRISIAESDELKEQLPLIWTVAQQVPYVKSFQMFPYISEVQDEISVYLQSALLTKELSPEEAMEKASEAVQYVLDDYWAMQ